MTGKKTWSDQGSQKISTGSKKITTAQIRGEKLLSNIRECRVLANIANIEALKNSWVMVASISNKFAIFSSVHVDVLQRPL